MTPNTANIAANVVRTLTRKSDIQATGYLSREVWGKLWELTKQRTTAADLEKNTAEVTASTLHECLLLSGVSAQSLDKFDTFVWKRKLVLAQDAMQPLCGIADGCKSVKLQQDLPSLLDLFAFGIHLCSEHVKSARQLHEATVNKDRALFIKSLKTLGRANFVLPTESQATGQKLGAILADLTRIFIKAIPAEPTDRWWRSIQGKTVAAIYRYDLIQLKGSRFRPDRN